MAILNTAPLVILDPWVVNVNLYAWSEAAIIIVAPAETVPLIAWFNVIVGGETLKSKLLTVVFAAILVPVTSIPALIIFLGVEAS